jgi:hypothetical protein
MFRYQKDGILKDSARVGIGRTDLFLITETAPLKLSMVFSKQFQE